MSSVSRIGLFIIFWCTTVLGFSCVQKIYLDPVSLKFFPNPDEIKPDAYEELRSSFFPKKNNEIQENILPEEIFNTGDNYSYLSRFYKKLENLERKKNNVVRILHFGDSIIWADIVTSRLKKKFQQDFGDGGRGAVPVFYKLERAFLNHGNPTPESSFIREKARPWGYPDHNIGFLGETFMPVTQYSTSTQILGQNQIPWNKAGLLLRLKDNVPNSDYPIIINITHNQGKLTKTENIKKGICQLYEYEIPESDKVAFNFEGTGSVLPYIDSLILESTYGISYSPVSIMGLELNDMLISDEDKFQCGMEKFKPDLIILQYGVNESQNLWLSSQRTPDFYINSTRKVLKRLKEKVKDSDILIIGPVERIRQDSSGNFITMPEMMKIREIYKNTANEFGVAFYDSFLAMGGQGKSRDLFLKGIIQQDRTHLTRPGGDYLADLFYIDFYNQYQRYLGYQNKVLEKKKEVEKKESNRAVNFTSKAYFYFFIGIFITINLVSKFPRLKIIFLLFYSYYFYMSWNIYPILLLIFSTVTDYFFALRIDTHKKIGKSGREFLLMSLISNLGLLFIFKYFNFSIEIFNHLVSVINDGSQIEKLEIILPVGISFYTFQTLSYTIDVYRGTMSAEPRFFRFALYVTFFPQLVAGPIVRANHFVPNMNLFARHFKPTFEKFSFGIFLIFSGLIKKLVADWIGVNLVDRVYSVPDMFSSLEIIAAFYGYAFQIYGDFSGYTDIAIGSALILGFHLTENFNRPYQSASITEFWRRWHISLGSWFRDYLYITLGGNKNRTYINLMVTMLLCGLWHGASFNFLIWGIYHGLFLAIERILRYPINFQIKRIILKENIVSLVKSSASLNSIEHKFNISKNITKRLINNYINNILRILLTFHIVVIGWIIFRMENVESILKMFEILTSYNLESPNLDSKMIIVLSIFFIWHMSPVILREKLKKIWFLFPASIQGIMAGILSIGVYKISTEAPRAFIYFQF